jgi:hypothetical protein
MHSLHVVQQLVAGIQSQPILHYSIGVVLLFINSLLLQSLVSNTGIQPRITHLSAAVYMLASGWVLAPNMVLPNLLGTLFCLFAVHSLHRLEMSANEASPAFFSGFLLSISLLFQPLLLVLFVFFLYKSLSFRWSIGKILYLMLLGMCMPLYFIWTLYFMWDKGYLLFTEIRNLFMIGIKYEMSKSYLLVLVSPFIALVGLAGWSVMASDAWKNVAPRSWLNFWWASSIILVLLGRATLGLNEGLYFLSLPFGASMPFFLLAPNRKKLRRTVFTLMFLLVQLHLLYLTGIIVPF